MLVAGRGRVDQRGNRIVAVVHVGSVRGALMTGRPWLQLSRHPEQPPRGCDTRTGHELFAAAGGRARFAVVRGEPPRPRQSSLSNLSFLFGYLLNELPFVACFWLLASTLSAIGQGDVDSRAVGRRSVWPS